MDTWAPLSRVCPSSQASFPPSSPGAGGGARWAWSPWFPQKRPLAFPAGSRHDCYSPLSLSCNCPLQPTASGRVSFPFYSPPVAIRHDPLLAPRGQPQLCGLSHRRPRGLRAKEPVGNAELWLPGHAWLLGGAAPGKPKAPDPQAPCRFGGPHPPSQPAIGGNLVPPTVERPGLPGNRRPRLPSREASRGERRGSAEALRPSACRPGPELRGPPHGSCELGHVSTLNRSWSFPKTDSRAPSAPTCSQGSRTLRP